VLSLILGFVGVAIGYAIGQLLSGTAGVVVAVAVGLLYATVWWRAVRRR